MEELPDQIYDAIKDLCAEGDNLTLLHKFDLALKKYRMAWDLLPESKTRWEASTWILAAIGDASFMEQNYPSGFDSFKLAMHCPNAMGNPFLHLRLGQCSYELHDFKRAADEMTRAYAIEGEEIFKDEDPKYFDFLKTKLREVFNQENKIEDL